MPRSVPSTVDPEVECWLSCDQQCGEDMELCDMGMDEQGMSMSPGTTVQGDMMAVDRLLLNIYHMFHRLMGCYFSCPAALFINKTSYFHDHPCHPILCLAECETKTVNTQAAPDQKSAATPRTTAGMPLPRLRWSAPSSAPCHVLLKR